MFLVADENQSGYLNLPGLDMKVGERVRWYVIGMGTEVNLHTPHWHGQTLCRAGWGWARGPTWSSCCRAA